MSYEVWSKDQYGRHEILTVLNKKGLPENRWDTPQDALAAAKRYVHDKNRNNPLTYEEQKRLATHTVCEVSPTNANEHIYAGNLIMARHKMIKVAGTAGDEVALDTSAPLQFYLGNAPDETPWYMINPRREPVTSLDDYLVTEKTLVFVHKQ